MILTLLLSALPCFAGDFGAQQLEALRQAEHLSADVRLARGRVAATLRDARRTGRPGAARCLRPHVKALGNLAWQAELAVHDIRYAGTVGYEADLDGPMAGLESIVAEADTAASVAAGCRVGGLVDLGPTTVSRLSAPAVLPNDTADIDDPLLPTWDTEPPRAQPFNVTWECVHLGQCGYDC